MKILYCNKFKFPFSGTEIYLFELMRLMRELATNSRAVITITHDLNENMCPFPFKRH